MSRFTSSTNATEAIKSHTELRLFIDAAFVSGNVRLCSGSQSLSFSGNTYIAVGDLQEVEDIIETTEIQPHNFTLTLSGVNATLLSYMRTETYHNRSLSWYYGWVNSNGVLVDISELNYEGRMNVMTGSIQNGVASISLSVTHRLNIWNKSAGWKYTQDDQFYLMGSGDNFFDKVSTIVGKALQWGEFNSATANAEWYWWGSS